MGVMITVVVVVVLLVLALIIVPLVCLCRRCIRKKRAETRSDSFMSSSLVPLAEKDEELDEDYYE